MNSLYIKVFLGQTIHGSFKVLTVVFLLDLISNSVILVVIYVIVVCFLDMCRDFWINSNISVFRCGTGLCVVITVK